MCTERPDNFEPPKKSAFQKWNDCHIQLTEIPGHDTVRLDGRKEGWNAAIESVLKIWPVFVVYHPPAQVIKQEVDVINKIIELKEK